MIFHIYVHCYMSKNKSENAKIYFHFHFHILVWAFYDHIRMKICLKFDFHRLQSSFFSNNINICRNVKYYCGITFNSQVYSIIFHCQLWTGSLRSQLMLVIIHMKVGTFWIISRWFPCHHWWKWIWKKLDYCIVIVSFTQITWMCGQF